MSWRARCLWSRVPPYSRLYARTALYRSERAAIVRSVAATVAPLLLLALLAVLLVAEPEVRRDSLGSGFPGSYVRAIALTMQKTAVASSLAVLLLIAVAWFARRAMLAWLVWRPGRIEVPPLEGAGVGSDAQIAELSAIFRERLALLRLQSSTPAPGAAPEGAFLDVLEGASTSDPVGSVIRVLRSAVPRYALTIQGVLRKRETAPQFGVTAQVSQEPGQAAPVIEFWESSWEKAARKAADGVTASILPRTRLCIGPWAGWRGYRMPPELLIAYERGSSHEQEREFDQARDCYWDALRLDPTNLTIRLQLGQLQEKAGNRVSALTNYLRIFALANPGRKLVPRGLHHSGARRECERALTLAKYRAIVLFGEGSIIEQWCGTSPGSGAARQQAGIREGDQAELRQEYEELLAPLAQVRRRDPAAEEIAHTTRLLLDAPCEPAEPPLDRALLRAELLRGAYRAAAELKLSLPRLERKPWRRPLSRRTIALTMICLEQRYALTQSRPPNGEELDALARSVYWAGWRPGPWALWWPSWLRRWQWHEHYNAACVYAMTLRTDLSPVPVGAAPNEGREKQEEQIRQRAARMAIERLERAITTRDSEFAATWRDWVVREDPDLIGLRRRPEFSSFKAVYFPTDGPPLAPPGQASKVTPIPQSRLPYGHADHVLIESLYTRDLLRAAAERQRERWSSRASTAVADRDLQDWLRAERRLWRRVQEVARKPYDWRVRQQLNEELCAAENGDAPLVVTFLRYESLDKTVRASREMANVLLELLDRRTARLREALDDDVRQDGRPSEFHRWIDALGAFDGSSPRLRRRRKLTKLCQRNADVWAALANWLAVEDAIADTIVGTRLAAVVEDHLLWRDAAQSAVADAELVVRKRVELATAACRSAGRRL